MASKRTQIPTKEKAYPYKSFFGSSKSMVVKTLNEIDVVCADEFGEYQTSVDRLDSGGVDWNRADLVKRGIYNKLYGKG